MNLNAGSQLEAASADSSDCEGRLPGAQSAGASETANRLNGTATVFAFVLFRAGECIKFASLNECFREREREKIVCCLLCLRFLARGLLSPAWKKMATGYPFVFVFVLLCVEYNKIKYNII